MVFTKENEEQRRKKEDRNSIFPESFYFSTKKKQSGGARKEKIEITSPIKRGRMQSLPYGNCPAPFAVNACREQKSRFGSEADI